MARYRYDKELDAIIEIREGSNYFDETKGNKGPAVISDIEGYRAMGADVACGGKRPFITSRRQHREYLRRNGYVETGNEAPKVYDDRPTARERMADLAHDLKRAHGDYGSNTGADAARAFAERNRR
ncbi:MAG: hypothetical protein KGL35_17140 [Bradyrhizobium sp.]|nr:hypothetical protein [Bradyrhizobium sp.]